jgi:PAP2 superfamily
MKSYSFYAATLLVAASLFASCTKNDVPFSEARPVNNPQMARAGDKGQYAFVAHSWMGLQLQLIKADGNFTPPVASRTFGYAGFTLYETIVDKLPQYRSIAEQVGAPPLPRMANHSIDEAIAANKSLHDLMISLFVYQGNVFNTQVQQKCQQLYEDNLALLTLNVPASKIELSESYGAAVASAVYAWSATDPIGHQGQMHNTDPAYTMTPWPGVWQPTPPAYHLPVQPHWGDVRAFLQTNTQGTCIAAMPIPFSTSPQSGFFNQAYEVYDISYHLSAEEQTIARFWADGGGTITPPGHMISIAMQVLQTEEAPLALCAEVYCKVGMAISDAFVACWKGKYTNTLMRPITYIRQQIDANWSPMLVTPPFPSFASGHATQSGAASAVLTSLFGPSYEFTDHTHDALGFVPRHFLSFEEAAQEAAISRLYGGIHYRMDNDEAIVAGKKIGSNISMIRFRK